MMSETAAAPVPVMGRCVPRSCYLLEYSVRPGGARLGDIYVGTTLGALRAAIREHHWAPETSPDLIMGYGALLKVWVVQKGMIVEGVDLHPYLRTGDRRCDRTLAWVIDNLGDEENDRWNDVRLVMDYWDHDHATMLPLLTRILDLHDRIDGGDSAAGIELQEVLEAAGKREVPVSYDGMTVDRLSIDWDAVAEVTKALREPVLDTDWVAVRWADPGLRPIESYLHAFSDPTDPDRLHVGWNMRENPADDGFGPPPPVEE